MPVSPSPKASLDLPRLPAPGHGAQLRKDRPLGGEPKERFCPELPPTQEPSGSVHDSHRGTQETGHGAELEGMGRPLLGCLSYFSPQTPR